MKRRKKRSQEYGIEVIGIDLFRNPEEVVLQMHALSANGPLQIDTEHVEGTTFQMTKNIWSDGKSIGVTGTKVELIEWIDHLILDVDTSGDVIPMEDVTRMRMGINQDDEEFLEINLENGERISFRLNENRRWLPIQSVLPDGSCHKVELTDPSLVLNPRAMAYLLCYGSEEALTAAIHQTQAELSEVKSETKIMIDTFIKADGRHRSQPHE
jgi:hypothetical protein